jgi:hypothetical protein
MDDLHMNLGRLIIVLGTVGLVALWNPRVLAQAPAQPASDITGTYTGQIINDPGDRTHDEPGVIVIAQTDGTLVVTLGERLDDLITATKVERHGDRVTFEASPSNDPARAARFDVTIEGTALTGTIAMTRDGEPRIARLEFTRP